jgi:eukaryotic-like serine/threonine-protein kinase
MNDVTPRSHEPRFENISATMVLRSDTPGLVPDTLIGSYRIVQQIGTGGMASVFEAVHLLLPRRAAIKVLHAELRGSAGMDTRMLQEATILDGLLHPGVSRVFECGLLPDGRPWIAMELVAGESLAAKMARDVRVSSAEVCNLIAAVADVLATVHPLGIVHRDLKPDNILFADAATGFPLRVIDWGVAHHGFEARLTLDGITCGTPVYMSPEQAAGRDIAPACDIYSLGVIAYEALVGEAPFEGRTLADIVTLHHTDAVPLEDRCPTAPIALCELVHRMIHKIASWRPTATEVREAMQQIARDIMEHGGELEVPAITIEPDTDDDIAVEHADAPPHWTPDRSMMNGSGYLLLRPRGGWILGS